MSNNYGGLTISYLLQGKDLGVSPLSISFSLIDSIWSFYARGTVSFSNSSGVFQESFFTAPGSLHSPSIKVGGKKLGLDMVVSGGETETSTNGTLESGVNANLVSAWSLHQKNRNTAWKDRISNIVSTLASDWASNTDISDTGNLGTWLQAGVTDAKFIQDVLLPNAYSGNADGSPWWCWGGLDDTLHFKNYTGLWRANGEYDDTIFWAAQTVDPTQSSPRPGNAAFSARFFTRPSKNVWKNFTFQRVDRETGLHTNVQDSVLNHPTSIGGLPRAQAFSPDSKNMSLGLFHKSQIDNFNGQSAHHFREDLLLDKALVLIPLNMSLLAGKKVYLDVQATHSNSSMKSTRHSGEYLVEMSEHIWSAEEKMAFSKLLLTRAYQTIPNNLPQRSVLS